MKDSKVFHPVLNIRTSGVTVREAQAFLRMMNEKYPDREYYLDGDTQSIGYKFKEVA